METTDVPLTRAELEAKIASLRDDLEDAIDLRDSFLGQEGQHISSKNISRFENMIAAIEENIANIEAQLATEV